MSESMILGVGVAVFALLVLGIILTIIEFRANVYPSKIDPSKNETARRLGEAPRTVNRPV